MDQYQTKEDVLKLGIIDPEIEEVSKHTKSKLIDSHGPEGPQAFSATCDGLFVPHGATAPDRLVHGKGNI